MRRHQKVIRTDCATHDAPVALPDWSTILARSKFTAKSTLFTMAVAEGIRGKAKTPEGEVRAEPLHSFVRARVAEYVQSANEKIEALIKTRPDAKLSKLTPQEPQFFKGRDAGNYLLAN